MLETQASPPDSFARRQCVSNKIDTCATVLAGEQCCEELSWTHGSAEQGARLRFELKMSADLRGCSTLDLEQRFTAHRNILPATH
jgi:hypothetical protein